MFGKCYKIYFKMFEKQLEVFCKSQMKLNSTIPTYLITDTIV